MRGFCLEYGIAIRQGAGVFRLHFRRVLTDQCNELTTAMRRLLGELFEDLGRIDQRVAAVTREIEGLAARDDHARRLMTVPGIGSAGLHSLAPRSATAVSSVEHATWRHGWVWCHVNFPPAARP